MFLYIKLECYDSIIMVKDYYCTKCKRKVKSGLLLIINNKGVCPYCLKTLETSKKKVKEVQETEE